MPVGRQNVKGLAVKKEKSGIAQTKNV